jgi:hypothetical protein
VTGLGCGGGAVDVSSSLSSSSCRHCWCFCCCRKCCCCCWLLQDAVLDLYLYYCLIGMGATSPSLRAASVAMLAVISVHNNDLVVGVVGECHCPAVAASPLVSRLFLTLSPASSTV